MLVWLFENYLELAGVLLSIFYLVLSIKQNIWLWPIGIVSSLLYILVFFNTKFYADMGLNGYYFFISIYGWINWTQSINKGSTLSVSNVGKLRAIVLFLIAIALFLILGYILSHFTDSPIPYWDALTTSGSIIATWMLTKKIIQHWIIWIFVDLISMGLYIYRGLYPTTVLFFIYTAMAVLGYLQWKRSLRENENAKDRNNGE
ncbi:MAG: nicotinamide riboside transporter PnuC [Bacteroidales bacterium]|jgi:nicotinamide mononucleotide transporter|nr:nicotinamide riboside transporter PnuC [Bacteroidales bacterium]